MTRILKLIVIAGLLLNLTACDKNTGNEFIDNETGGSEVVTGRNLQIEFSTEQWDGHYAPHHILAVWIEDENGTFVRSLKVRAEERERYLSAWRSASGRNKTDAITGATITQHTQHSISWNLQNKDAVDITEGNYNLKLELTDYDGPGPVAAYPFRYSDSIASQHYDNIEVFNEVSITYSETVE